MLLLLIDLPTKLLSKFVYTHIYICVIRCTYMSAILHLLSHIFKSAYLHTSWLPVTWTGGNKIKMVMKNGRCIHSVRNFSVT